MNDYPKGQRALSTGSLTGGHGLVVIDPLTDGALCCPDF